MSLFNESREISLSKTYCSSLGLLAGRPLSPPSDLSDYRFEASRARWLAVLCLRLGLRPRHGRSGFEIGQRLPSYSDWRIFDGGTGQLAAVQTAVQASFWWMGVLAAPVIGPALVLTSKSMA
ncbi:hypothetical protein RchiOBHm_Chr1g0340301 [Rosa chinensis]|uniref:Uncharacterized protein n=1 Tax=Rosa chinensis TaxID=74649 RepID=A0A2P6SDG2_ROSCH|nr:hypothetical protein RchiOBHm_Chr1g0340301 [Rosa chinensis]